MNFGKVGQNEPAPRTWGSFPATSGLAGKVATPPRPWGSFPVVDLRITCLMTRPTPVGVVRTPWPSRCGPGYRPHARGGRPQ